MYILYIPAQICYSIRTCVVNALLFKYQQSTDEFLAKYINRTSSQSWDRTSKHSSRPCLIPIVPVVIISITATSTLFFSLLESPHGRSGDIEHNGNQPVTRQATCQSSVLIHWKYNWAQWSADIRDKDTGRAGKEGSGAGWGEGGSRTVKALCDPWSWCD